jgi:hypothetical protein
MATNFFDFVTENMEKKNFNWQSKLPLHRFFALTFFFVKVLRQSRHIWEAMKR